MEFVPADYSKHPMTIRAHSAPWRNCVEFLAMQGGAIGTEISMEVKENQHQACDPTFSLRYDEAQVLMDDLWVAGLRPTEGAGSAGSLRATEKHLNDMRRIAFDRLKINTGE